jgi:hypothetical protein
MDLKEQPSTIATDSTARDAGTPTYVAPKLTLYGEVRELTTGSGSKTADTAPLTGNKVSSDRRLKDDIKRVGTHPLGFGLYIYSYNATKPTLERDSTHFGAMADEVEHVMPAAVTVGTDGYKLVDYAMLGILDHASRTLH